MAVACPVDMPEGAHCLRGQDSAQAHYLIVMPAQWTPSVLRSKFIEPIGTGQCRLRRGPTSPCRLGLQSELMTIAAIPLRAFARSGDQRWRWRRAAPSSSAPPASHISQVAGSGTRVMLPSSK